MGVATYRLAHHLCNIKAGACAFPHGASGWHPRFLMNRARPWPIA
jgi:hypothetical protein